jgi:hypothetical protein
MGRINFPRHVKIAEHRSGWNYAMSGLKHLHNPEGVLLDDFIESAFAWHYHFNFKHKILPYQSPWVGLIHNPPQMPQWFGDGKSSNQKIFARLGWIKSLKHCKGLFTLSKYHKKHLKKQVSCPINVLFHPTETPELKFTFDAFKKNLDKKIVQIGWWLRKAESIHKLQTSFKKAVLQIKSFWFDSMKLSEQPFERDLAVEYIDYLPNDGYDDLLSKNIVFLDLYDSSANNAIIECIVRNTPILVSKLEPVIEYLGEDYPFYFSSLEEASSKANDLNLIEQTYEFLIDHPIKEKLTLDYFTQSFIESPIYQSL